MDRSNVYREVAQRLRAMATSNNLDDAAKLNAFSSVAGLDEVAGFIKCVLGRGDIAAPSIWAAGAAYCDSVGDGGANLNRLLQIWHMALPESERADPTNFCPFVTAPPSSWVAPNVPHEQFQSAAQERAKAIKASIFLIKKANPASAREALRQHLMVLESKNSSGTLRAFLSAAIVVADMMDKKPELASQLATPLQAIADGLEEVTAGAENVAPPRLSILLHAVARQDVSTARADKLREEYELAGIQPGKVRISFTQLEELANVLAHTHEILDNFGSNPQTDLALAGQIEKLQPFIDPLRDGTLQDQALANVLAGLRAGCSTMRAMLPDIALGCTIAHEAVRAAKQNLLNPAWAARLTATARLFDHRTLPGEKDRLRAEALHQESNTTHERTLRTQLYHVLVRVEEQLTQAMTSNGDRAPLVENLKRAAGVFTFLNQETLGQLAQHCADVCGKSVGDDAFSPRDLAENISMLVLASRGLITAQTAEAKAREWLEGAIQTNDRDAFVDVATDPDTLEVLNEELGAVLSVMQASATPAIVGAPPSDSRSGNTPAAVLRRNFHLIKGSARMVLKRASGGDGYSYLSDVAWHLERAYNHLLDQRITITQDLLDASLRAISMLRRAHEELELSKRCRVEWSSLSDDVDALIAGKAVNFRVETKIASFDLPMAPPVASDEIATPALEMEAATSTASPPTAHNLADVSTPAAAVEEMALTLDLEQPAAAEVAAEVQSVPEARPAEDPAVGDEPPSAVEPIAETAPVHADDTPHGVSEEPIAELAQIHADETPLSAEDPVVLDDSAAKPLDFDEALESAAEPTPVVQVEEHVAAVEVVSEVAMCGKLVQAWLYNSFQTDAREKESEIRKIFAPAIWDDMSTEQLYEFMRCVHTAGSLCEAVELADTALLARSIESLANTLRDTGATLAGGDRQALVDALIVLADALDDACMPRDSIRDTSEALDAVDQIRDRLHVGLESITASTVSPPFPETVIEEIVEPPAAVVTDDVAQPATPQHEDRVEAVHLVTPEIQAVIESLAPVQAQDDIDPAILGIFADEAMESAPRTSALIEAMALDPKETAHINARGEMLRILHTLKGGARTAGANRLGDIIHDLEAWLQLREGAFGSAERVHAQRVLDHFFQGVEILARGETFSVSMPIEAQLDAAEGAAPESPATPAPTAADTANQPARNDSPVTAAAAAAATDTPARTQLKVNSAVIEQIASASDLAGILQARARLALFDLTDTAQAQTQTLESLRALMEAIHTEAETKITAISERGDDEFDPLEFDRFTRLQELTKMCLERVADMASLVERETVQIDKVTEIEERRHLANDTLQAQASLAMAVPLSRQEGRFARLIRLTAEKVGRKTQFTMSGDADLHTTIYEPVCLALEHLLRNSVAHGIEPSEERTEAGKAPTGVVSMTSRGTGSQIEIVIQDDGRGIDPARIRARAIDLEIMSAQDLDRMTEVEVINLIFAAGFTTTLEADEISGRGIGMDAVRTGMRSMGGEVKIASVVGRGTTITIVLPSEVNTFSAIPVRCHGYEAMVPIALVERFTVLSPEQARDATELRKIMIAGQTYEVLQLVAPDAGGKESEQPRLLMSVTASHPTAVLLSDNDNVEKIVMKPVAATVKAVSGVLGVTINSSGTPRLVVDPAELASLTKAAIAPVAASTPAQPVVIETKADQLQVFVVDDSNTVRTITSRFLKRHGFVPNTARNGLDALDKMNEGYVPDVILLDLEMPEMDGFSYTRALRSEEKWARVPIIMISSRTAETYKQKARELQINAYLTKPYAEQELLATITALTGSSSLASVTA